MLDFCVYYVVNFFVEIGCVDEGCVRFIVVVIVELFVGDVVFFD